MTWQLSFPSEENEKSGRVASFVNRPRSTGTVIRRAFVTSWMSAMACYRQPRIIPEADRRTLADFTFLIEMPCAPLLGN
jgi:hypothetical protein